METQLASAVGWQAVALGAEPVFSGLAKPETPSAALRRRQMGLHLNLKRSKSALDAATQIKLQGFISDFYEQINTLQGKVFDLHKEKDELARKNRELEAQLDRRKEWELQKTRYELATFPSGDFACAQKPGVENPEPVHYLCADCFEKERRSILRPTPGDRARLVCRQCDGVVFTEARLSDAETMQQVLDFQARNSGPSGCWHRPFLGAR